MTRVVLLLAVLLAACGGAPGAAGGPSLPSAAAAATLAPQATEGGAVTVELRPLDGAVVAFGVAMNTHSVDLDAFDLSALATLRLDGAAWAAPTAWEAPRGGHHRSGTLTFGSVTRARFDAAKVVEVELRDLASPVRAYRWER